MRSALSIAVFAAAVVAAPAQADIIPNTGAAVSGGADLNWSVMWRPISASGASHGALTNAPLVTAIPSPPWQPNVAGNNWIGVNSSATIFGSPGDGSHRYEYAFTTNINLAAAQTVTGAVGYDNFFAGAFYDGSFDTGTGTYTPGTEFLTPLQLLGSGNTEKAGFCRDGDGFLPSSSFPTCTVNFSFLLPAGAHSITFLIQGDGTTDGFILNQRGATLVTVPEPASLALLAVGLAGLGLNRRLTAKRRD